MSSSNIVEDTEECSSNESGWTTYIASSPDHEHHDEDDDEDGCSIDEDVNKKDYEQEDAENVETDDSMASDASSGPSDPRRLYGSVGRKTYSMDGLSNAGKKNDRKLCSGKKGHQQGDRKKLVEKLKAAKENPEIKANSPGNTKKK